MRTDRALVAFLIVAGCGSEASAPSPADAGTVDAQPDAPVADEEDASIPCVNPTTSFIARRDSDLQLLRGCTAIDGDLAIWGTQVTTLDGLESLRSISGSLSILANANLASLKGLDSLEEVGGDIQIGGPADDRGTLNGRLQSLDGLSALRSVGGDLIIRDNPQLYSIDALSSLTTVGGELGLRADKVFSLAGLAKLRSVGGMTLLNLNITSLAGLESLETVGRTGDVLPWYSDFSVDQMPALVVRENRRLNSLAGLEQLESIHGSLVVEANGALTDVSALRSLEVVQRDLILSNNGGLPSLASLAKLKELGGLTLRGAGTLKSLHGLEGITTLPRGLTLFHNEHLEDLDALSSLAGSVGGIVIDDNDSLASIAGLKNVTDVGPPPNMSAEGYHDPFLSIASNASLSSLGLSALSSVVGRVRIRDNPQLSACEVAELALKLGKAPDDEDSETDCDCTGNGSEDEVCAAPSSAR